MKITQKYKNIDKKWNKISCIYLTFCVRQIKQANAKISEL